MIRVDHGKHDRSAGHRAITVGHDQLIRTGIGDRRAKHERVGVCPGDVGISTAVVELPLEEKGLRTRHAGRERHRRPCKHVVRRRHVRLADEWHEYGIKSQVEHRVKALTAAEGDCPAGHREKPDLASSVRIVGGDGEGFPATAGTFPAE